MKANLHHVFAIAMFLLMFSASSQNSSWEKVETLKNSKIISKLNLNKNNVHLFKLNANSFKESLSSSVSRHNKSNKKSTVISIPGKQGKLEAFEVYEASVFSPGLAAK